GRELTPVLCHRGLETRRTDFFLELPQHAKVQRHTGIARGSNSPQRGQRGTFVVGCAAAEVTVAISGEGEGIAVPRFGVARCGLDIEMVIDGERWRVGPRIESSVNDGIAGGLDDRRL